jgi:rod shape-determining protein MreC
VQQIIYFFIRNKNFLLFAFLFFISLALTINSHSYHSSKFVSSANFLSGGIYNMRSGITDYFNLKEQNDILHEENNRLRLLLMNGAMISSEISLDSTVIDTNYLFTAAQVISNNYAGTRNNLTINKGENDSIKIDMGVISSEGVVGIINSTSSNYASVQSVLNTSSRIVGKFKKSNQFGTMVWDAKAPNIVQLTEIPRIANVMVGDTIITDSKSTIFPEGIPIGSVINFQRDPSNDYYAIDVELFSDMTRLKHLYVISHRDAPEIKALEQEVTDGQ